MSTPHTTTHTLKGGYSAHSPSPSTSGSPSGGASPQAPSTCAPSSHASSTRIHYGPYTVLPPNSASPPTLKSMVAETTGQKRKRPPPDIAGIPMSVICEPERHNVAGRERREVRTPNRRGLCAKEAATTYKPARTTQVYTDDTDTDDDDIVLVF